eukprot:CAMPEP_0118937398 /NCGR_PEP_ID=MMETSP1169-20130426/22610_1 /TAXON_ID=36882 /ORGANISM="Pyramimonas obovata, Strain CCMP722" /LENGTH=128 /DNA_ID=CAMNT_0006881013 /DNA_START=22 /DNA_END=404 /DNA_ORIENTATION=+
MKKERLAFLALICVLALFLLSQVFTRHYDLTISITELDDSSPRIVKAHPSTQSDTFDNMVDRLEEQETEILEEEPSKRAASIEALVQEMESTPVNVIKSVKKVIKKLRPPGKTYRIYESNKPAHVEKA